MDGGIRSGQDVLKALALGARGTYIGRAFVYGLGAMGEAGVTQGAARSSARSSTSRWRSAAARDIGDVDRSILLPGTFPT